MPLSEQEWIASLVVTFLWSVATRDQRARTTATFLLFFGAVSLCVLSIGHKVGWL